MSGHGKCGGYEKRVWKVCGLWKCGYGEYGGMTSISWGMEGYGKCGGYGKCVVSGSVEGMGSMGYLGVWGGRVWKVCGRVEVWRVWEVCRVWGIWGYDFNLLGVWGGGYVSYNILSPPYEIEITTNLPT